MIRSDCDHLNHTDMTSLITPYKTLPHYYFNAPNMLDVQVNHAFFTSAERIALVRA